MSHDFAKKGDAKKSSKTSAKKSPAKKAVKKPAAKKQAAKTSPVKPAAPAWLWFLAGVISTIAVQAFYHLSQVDTSSQPLTEDQGPSVEEVAAY